MKGTRGVLVLLVVLTSLWCSANTIDIGQLVLASSTPTAGNQELQIFNFTGSTLCDGVTYGVCDNLNITNWTLVVNYTDAGGSHTTTFAASDPIGPSTGGAYAGLAINPWDFDQSCSSGTCPPFDTTITNVTFSGSIGSTDPTPVNVTSCVPGPCTVSTFFASPTFTVNYTPTLIVDPASGFVYSNPVELLVNSSSGGGTGAVPEPSGLALSITGVCSLAATLLRRKRAKSLAVR